MTMLLIGQNGQVGFELRRALAPLGPVVAVDRSACDLADASSVRDCVTRVAPRVIVNAGAYTAVDRAETDAERAFAVNGAAPGVLGQAAARLGALVVHYSTDYVFDGHRPTPYTETDEPRPLSVYGRSKLAGEQALAASGAAHLTLRTSWVYGVHGGNFVKTMLKLAAEREQLGVVADQWGAPTSAALLADVTAHLIRPWLRGARATFPTGLYHVAAAGETTWHAYARLVIETARAAGRPLRLAPEALAPLSSADYPTAAKRPAQSRLDTGKLRRTFELHLPPWQDGVLHMLNQWLPTP